MKLSRPGRSAIAVTIYLLGFVILLVIVSRWYLFPAIAATRGALPRERKLLSANAAITLALVLFILFAGLILTFRIGRFFSPKPPRNRRTTNYPDVWAESARRVQPPPPDSLEDHD